MDHGRATSGTYCVYSCIGHRVGVYVVCEIVGHPDASITITKRTPGFLKWT